MLFNTEQFIKSF